MSHAMWRCTLKFTMSKTTNILLGVTGGIAAYKSADIVRRLKERDCAVRVVMTRGAREFMQPLTFQALSGKSVSDERCLL